MKWSLIGFGVVIVLSIHSLLKEISCIKKGTQVNYLSIFFSIIGIICFVLVLILTLGGN